MAPTRDGAAVLAVLTQRLLLSLIASFQRGPQGVVVPLLKRLVADGFVRCAVRIHRVGWFDWRESRRITTLLCKDVRPQRAWADRAVPEAIAQYDVENLHALRTLVATTTAFAAAPQRAVPQLLHRVAEAAAAFGRVDILSWLHSQHDVFTTQPLLLSFCVKHATRHGQITVVEWIEQTFSSHALEILRDYVLHALVQQRDSKMIQWLCAHKLGVVPARSLRFAAERGNVDTLRVLLEDVVVHAPHREALVALAVRAGQADVVAYLVGDRAFPFTTTTLDKAIAQRQLAVAKCLLDHRENLRRSERANLVSSSLVQQLIASNDLAMLSMLASVKNAAVLGCTVMTCCHFSRPSDAAVRVLLPLSSVEDATVTLLRFAVRKQASIVDTILAGTRAPLPAVAVAFVSRIANDSLGPLATRAMEFYDSRESGLMDEIVASVSKASREDVVDTVLRFLPGPAFSLTSILKADAKRPGGAACDEPFLQLCLSLRQSERDSHHRAIQQYLHTRKKPRAATSIK